MFYSVYVAQSLKDGKFYTGTTNNVARRLKEHNYGVHSTPSTKNRGPFRLVYKEDGLTREAARQREKFLKSGAGRELRSQLLKSKSPG